MRLRRSLSAGKRATGQVIGLAALLWLLGFLAHAYTTSASPARPSPANVWMSTIAKHDNSLKELNEKLSTEVNRIRKELKAKQAEAHQDPKCTALVCKDLKKALQAMLSVKDRAGMAWVMADVGTGQLREFVDSQQRALPAMEKGTRRVALANFLQGVAQATADVAAAIAISAATGEPANLTESLKIIGSEIANFTTNKIIDAATGYQSAVGSEGTKAAASLGGGPIAEDIANHLAVTLSGMGTLTTLRVEEKLVMRAQFLPSAAKLSKGKTAAGGFVTTMAVQSVLHAITANARGEVKKDLKRLQKQIQKAMIDQTSWRVAILIQEKNTEDMKKYHTQMGTLVSMLENVRASCELQIQRTQCLRHFKDAVEQAKARYQTKIGPLLERRRSAKDRLRQARERYQKDLATAQERHQKLRQARDQLSRAEILWKNRALIENLATRARDPGVRERYRKELAELRALGEPGPYRRRVARLEGSLSTLWKEIDQELKRIELLSLKKAQEISKTTTAVTAANEELSQAILRARSQLATCSAPSPSALKMRPIPSRRKIARGYKGVITPGDYYPLLIEAEENLLALLRKVHIRTRTQPNCKGRKVSGRVLSTRGSPITGAVVSVEVNGRKFVGKSRADGGYQLSFPREEPLPEELMATANKPGFNTATRVVRREENQNANIYLSPLSKYVIQIDSTLHHLGDGNYSGSINSQFQRRSSEGLRYEKIFVLDQDRLPQNTLPAKLVLTVKGSQQENPVTINDTKIGTLGFSKEDGSASATEIDFDLCILKPGRNKIEIHSSRRGDGDADDFEFVNLQIVMTPAQELEAENTRLATLSSVIITDQDFRKPLSSVAEEGHFWIKAKGQSRCPSLKAIAKVAVYPKGANEADKVQVTLVETGPDSSEFHSLKGISVAELSASPGQTIIVRSGLRGASVKVTGRGGETGKEGLPAEKDKRGPTQGTDKNPRQEPVKEGKSVQWTTYRLEVRSHSPGSLPTLDVIRLSFRKSPKRVQLRVTSYPVSLSRNDQTGEILWAVNWGSGDIEDQRITSDKAEMDALSREATRMKRGSVSKSALTVLINRYLGPKARHK